MINTGTGVIKTLTSPYVGGGGDFGFSVGIDGSNAVVGAPFETASGITLAGNVYTFNAGTGGLTNTLISPNVKANGNFGYSVGIDDGILVIGAPLETASGMSLAGNVYTFSATSGSSIDHFSSPNVQSNGEFGFAVAIHDSTFVVGAYVENTPTTAQAGNAYIF